MKDYTHTNKKTGNTNANPNLPPQWNDCRNFDVDDNSYGCCGIVRKTSCYQYCRRCHEAMTMQKHREEMAVEFEGDDFTDGLVDWNEAN